MSGRKISFTCGIKIFLIYKFKKWILAVRDMEEDKSPKLPFKWVLVDFINSSNWLSVYEIILQPARG